jgi:hypothetical protein
MKTKIFATMQWMIIQQAINKINKISQWTKNVTTQADDTAAAMHRSSASFTSVLLGNAVQ